VLTAPARAQSGGSDAKGWRHALSLFDDIRYPPGFKHFEYVNPNAPKGGVVRLPALATFDNFNVIVAGLKGTIATGIDLIYDTLMVSSLDEESTEYGLLVETVSFPADFTSATYRLRPTAKFHDRKPVTPEDVIFSLNAFKKHSPMFSAYYQHIVKAEMTNEHEVTFVFDQPGNRELPNIVGQLSVLPRHWW